ncbi:ATP-binding cassette domain-containing protein [Pyrobaculum aerophilum]|uniref:ATP-binding cassette domain-containing protein n=1 Tax=Pyrobaculum aerophilum TaxID=13773 RepID=UPI0023F0FA13|nr:ATP-binding cassette domain-containing protein [Pyrobaculum aerophilum]MCX8136767.1 ATP-binding cassette domain-containing protein [Pyrobaculum aerophilum]
MAELVEGWAEPPAVKQGTSVVVKNAVLGHGGRAVLHVESLVLEPGDFLWIRGPTGAGKSTLGKAIAGLIKPLEGSVEAPEGAIYIGNDDYISTGLCMKTSRFGRNTRGRKWKGPRGSPA